jgi:hypothetical protein
MDVALLALAPAAGRTASSPVAADGVSGQGVADAFAKAFDDAGAPTTDDPEEASAPTAPDRLDAPIASPPIASAPLAPAKIDLDGPIAGETVFSASLGENSALAAGEGRGAGFATDDVDKDAARLGLGSADLAPPAAENAPTAPKAQDLSPPSASNAPTEAASLAPIVADRALESPAARPALAERPAAPATAGVDARWIEVAANAATSPAAPSIAEIAVRTPRLIEIRLDPPELGVVTLSIESGDRGRVDAVVSADLPTTLDLLRQHTDLLVQQLERSGFAGANLAFAEGRREPPAFAAAAAAGEAQDDAAEDEAGEPRTNAATIRERYRLDDLTRLDLVI